MQVGIARTDTAGVRRAERYDGLAREVMAFEESENDWELYPHQNLNHFWLTKIILNSILIHNNTQQLKLSMIEKLIYHLICH